MKPKRLVIIGLDGVPLSLLKDLTNGGIMPNTAKLMTSGFLTETCSSIPEISSVAWSCIVTGENPGRHGIFGFTDLASGAYQLRFPNFSDLKAPSFWNLARGKSIIINVPSTYPVQAMNGVHISGFVAIDINKSVHPTSLVSQLESLDYRLDVDSQKAHTNLDLFLEDLDQTLTARIKAGEYLWDYTDWQTFMLTFTGTDRLMHFLFAVYEDKDHRHHNDFLNHFRKIDQAIGDITAKLADGDALLMLSDHGFEKLETDVYVNYLLAGEGFLTFEPEAPARLENIDSATKAFAMDPARIYVNEKGKYPAGSVAPENKEACLKDLENLFASFEVDGKKVVKYIYRKQDVYAGPYLDDGPDLVLIPEKGFNLRGTPAAKELTGKGVFTGKHTYEDAFLFVSDKELAGELGDRPSVTDVGKLIRSLVTNT
jgi:predicted AlkP superfamily phosphohydrolase/phosphomutase